MRNAFFVKKTKKNVKNISKSLKFIAVIKKDGIIKPS